jgi:hypothetical protein
MLPSTIFIRDGPHSLVYQYLSFARHALVYVSFARRALVFLCQTTCCRCMFLSIKDMDHNHGKHPCPHSGWDQVALEDTKVDLQGRR